MRFIAQDFQDNQFFFKYFESVFRNSTRNSKEIAFKYFQWLFLHGLKNCTKMATQLDDINSQQLNHFIKEEVWDYYQLKYPKIKFKWQEENPESMNKICPRLYKKLWDIK